MSPLLPLEGSIPEVPEANPVPVVLEAERRRRRVGRVLPDFLMGRRSDEFRTLLDHDTVVEDGHPCGAVEVVAVEPRPPPDDVVALPLDVELAVADRVDGPDTVFCRYRLSVRDTL